MTTQAQMKANRRNALKSTGPRSAEGKALARQNATKHGLLIQHVIVRGESPRELDNFRKGIYAALCPQGALEEFLVDKIINAAWRLRRLTKIESELLEEKDYYGEESSISQVFHQDNCPLLTFSRYESAMERSLYRALHELQRTQTVRLDRTRSAPISIELNNNTNE